MIFRPLLSALLLCAAQRPASDIQWEASLEAALARAKAENRVVFLAINMDGEYANDLLAEEVYTDSEIVTLSQRTVNVVASVSEHRKPGKACTRFAGIECKVHQDVERAMRKSIVKAGSDGHVVAPQHVFLDPNGEVLLSVPYQISQGELTWCFQEAMRLTDFEHDEKPAKGARPPFRLIMGGVFDVGASGETTRPLSEEELLELIKEIRSGSNYEGREANFLRVVTTNHPEAVHFAEIEMKGQYTNDLKVRDIRVVGLYSPPPFWESLGDFIKDPDPTVRNATAVAFEQLAAPDSVKTIKKALGKEKEAWVAKNWIRALGTAGADDKSARSLLLKKAKSEKDETLRVNAILALAGHLGDAKVRALVLDSLAADEPRIRTAAACSIALARDLSFRTDLEKRREREQDETAADALNQAIQVLDGANLSVIGKTVRDVAKDLLWRERFFGYETA